MRLGEAERVVERFNQTVRELLALILLPVGARVLLEWMVTTSMLPSAGKWLGVMASFAVLGVLMWMVSTGPRRSKFLGRLHAQGLVWPLAYSASLLYFSASSFTALLILMNQAHGGLAPTPDSQLSTVSFSPLQDFFLWHFLDAIPVLRVPETLLFKAPYAYTKGSIGWIVLAFKVSVVAPVIAAFAVSFRLLGAAQKSEGAA